jgi:hypothetical protein
LDSIAPHVDDIAFVLVGSVATGYCRQDSDVDIALVFDEPIYSVISRGTFWGNGRPSETRLDGVQLHYYGISFEQIEAKLKDLDDAYLYVYSNAVVLQDRDCKYERRLGDMLSHTPAVRRQRLEGKLDMLLRRAGALRSSVENQDPLASARICIELITLCLKVIALLDDIPFDPRKRLFATALSGDIGRRIEPKVRGLFCLVGELGNRNTEFEIAVSGFLERIQQVGNILCQEAQEQGFRVGLDRPDPRHIEG